MRRELRTLIDVLLSHHGDDGRSLRRDRDLHDGGHACLSPRGTQATVRLARGRARGSADIVPTPTISCCARCRRIARLGGTDSPLYAILTGQGGFQSSLAQLRKVESPVSRSARTSTG